MASKVRRVLVRLGLALLVLILAGVVFAAGWIAPTGTGYVAKMLCSTVFVTGLDPERAFAEDLRPQNYISGEVDRDAHSVTSTLAGLAPRTAVYRPGLGCTLVIEADADDVRAVVPGDRVAPPPIPPDDRPWPMGDRLPEGEPAGVDRGALSAALDSMFSEPDPERPLWTRAVVVVHKGQLVAERYAPGITQETRLLGWSMTKSVTAALVGALVLEGQLDVNAPAPVAEWSGEGDPRRAITLDQLLRMSSGLEFAEVYGPLSDATDMLFGARDSVALPLSKPLVAEPGARWSYSSGTSNIISRIVRDAVTGSAGGDLNAYWSYPARALFVPVGMRSAVMEPDESGTFVGSSFMYATARDWARFGMLHLQDGVWEGQRILPEGWSRYVSTPTAAAPRGQYGAHWWTNTGAPQNPSDRRFPSLPTDTYQASGFQGQAVIVIPSRELVVVRMGMTHDRSVLDLDGFVAGVLAALPE